MCSLDTSSRTFYDLDVSDNEWAILVTYLPLTRGDAQERHIPTASRSGLAWDVPPSTLRSPGHQDTANEPESGHRERGDRAKRSESSEVYLAVDTLGDLLAICLTPANDQDRAQVAALARVLKEATGEVSERP